MDEPGLSTELVTTAARAARAGGQTALQLSPTHPILPTTDDQRGLMETMSVIRETVVAEIRAAYPHHTVLCGDDIDLTPDSGETWLVEPLDGVGNFARLLPIYCTSVAFRSHDRYLVGVVYDPMSDELFQARLGKGSTLNEEPIIVEHVSEGIGAYRNAVVATDWPSDSERRVRNVSAAQFIATSTLALVALGSPVLGMCYVAAGRVHGYWNLQLRHTQVAAVKVLLGEAGGVLTNLRGASWLHSDGGYLATNGAIHGEMVRNLRAVLEP